MRHTARVSRADARNTMLNAIVTAAVIGLMIFLTALFVAAEFATVYARRTKVSQLAAQDDELARALLPILEDPKRLDRYVAASQVGITVSSLILGAYAQSAIATTLADPVSELLAAFGLASSPEAAAAAAQSLSVTLVLLGVTALTVVLGELFPKSLAIQYPESMAMALVWPMRISLFVFAIPIWLFNGTASLILRVMGRSREEAAERLHSAAEIELLVTESHEGGLLDDNERRLLRNALRLRDLSARQVMVHRTRMIAAPLSTEAERLLQIAIEGGFSRIPLYRESIDDIAGFVHIKDVFRLHVRGESDVSSVMREVLYVPETLAVTDVWEQLNKQRQYLAIVFDEFGGTAGMITLEDLIEEIFGELQDEFDDETAVIARDKEGRIYLRGDLLVTDVNEYLELDLPTDNVDSLGGLVFSGLGRPPVEGDEVAFGDVVMRVESMEDLSVGEVSLRLPPSEDGAPFTEWDMADHE